MADVTNTSAIFMLDLNRRGLSKACFGALRRALWRRYL